MRWTLCLLVVGGCAASADLTRTEPVTAATLALVADSLAVASGGRRAAAARRLAVAGVTPLADGGFTWGPVVGGYLPGRHALGRPQLVVVGAPLGSADVPALLEAVRGIAGRSEENLPERTILVALWDASRGGSLASAVGPPLWPREAVVSVVTLGGVSPDGRIPVVPVEPDADPYALAARLTGALLQASRYVSAPADSLP